MSVKPAWAAPENEANQCIAPYQFIELQGQDTGLESDGYGSRSAVLGMYERISPDGRFVLRSFSGRRLGDVALVELPAPWAASSSPSSAQGVQGVVRTYTTPLKNEAFPVQGSWRYLVNPDGEHYALADVLVHGAQAQALFQGGMTGFYAAAAELPNDGSLPPDQVRIRSLSWPAGDGVNSQGVGALTARTITVDVKKNRVLQDSGRVNLCGQRRKEDGPLYALPMISSDGLEFSAMPQTPVQGQPTMRIFGFGADGKGCVLHETFHNASGKTVFGFAHTESPMGKSGAAAGNGGADVAFEANGQIWWYSRQLQDSWPLAPPLALAGVENGEWVASAFPGITRDGRVIYGVTLLQCATRPCQRRVGYIVADPYQLPAVRARLRDDAARDQKFPRCISVQAVEQERLDFARARGIAKPPEAAQ